MEAKRLLPKSLIAAEMDDDELIDMHRFIRKSLKQILTRYLEMRHEVAKRACQQQPDKTDEVMERLHDEIRAVRALMITAAIPINDF